MKSILLVGQSNMAGRGFIETVPEIINEHVLMLRNGRWQIMSEPVNTDRHVAGIGLAPVFASLWAQDHPSESIVLFPVQRAGAASVIGIQREHFSAMHSCSLDKLRKTVR